MSVATVSKTAEKFRKMADALTTKIAHESRPMTQNPTPKRNREYQSRLIEARNLERTQKALIALADVHEQGTVPAELVALKTKDEVARLVRKYVESKYGYYSACESDDYSVTTPEARILQSMIEGNSQERAERERLRKIGELEARVKVLDIPGYFPTPAPVVQTMIELARIAPGMRVLEPSAGNGNIADAIKGDSPSVRIDVYEVNGMLRSILSEKGYHVAGEDFMESDTGRKYDRILMNPPFEKQQDIDHVERAYQHLNEGGVLVSIMSPSFEFRSNQKSEDFRRFLEFVNAEWEPLPSGAFKQSGTGVETRILVIRK